MREEKNDSPQKHNTRKLSMNRLKHDYAQRRDNELVKMLVKKARFIQCNMSESDEYFSQNTGHEANMIGMWFALIRFGSGPRVLFVDWLRRAGKKTALNEKKSTSHLACALRVYELKLSHMNLFHKIIIWTLDILHIFVRICIKCEKIRSNKKKLELKYCGFCYFP